MNIIFGDSVNDIPDRYIVLELDTFSMIDSHKTVTAYCLVETLALGEFATLESHKKIHADLISSYRNKNWKYCEEAITGLMGRWNGELDTFYTDLLNRVEKHKQNGVPEDWDATLVK